MNTLKNIENLKNKLAQENRNIRWLDSQKTKIVLDGYVFTIAEINANNSKRWRYNTCRGVSITKIGDYILKKPNNEYFHDPAVKCQEMCEIEIGCTIMYEQLKFDCRVPRFEFRNTNNDYLYQLQVIKISFIIPFLQKENSLTTNKFEILKKQVFEKHKKTVKKDLNDFNISIIHIEYTNKQIDLTEYLEKLTY